MLKAAASSHAQQVASGQAGGSQIANVGNPSDPTTSRAQRGSSDLQAAANSEFLSGASTGHTAQQDVALRALDIGNESPEELGDAIADVHDDED